VCDVGLPGVISEQHICLDQFAPEVAVGEVNDDWILYTDQTINAVDAYSFGISMEIIKCLTDAGVVVSQY
jgi:hypothetical protein